MSERRICLTHNDADRMLELSAVSGTELEPSDLQPQDFCADSKLIREVQAKLLGDTSGWVNVLVGSQRDRWDSKLITCHCCEFRLPSGSVLHVGDGVYVASPNFNLLLQSSALHVTALCQLLGRYWGTFALKGGEGGGIVERAPLTSEESLAGFLAGMRGVHGLPTLKDSMRYTCEGAASPQEVNLQLLLSLPALCNGFGLRKPQMNYRIELDAAAKRFYDVDSIRIDLFWPEAGFGLEYMGEKEHADKMLDDTSRWYAAQSMGIELWSVTKEQLSNAWAVDLIAREVARRTHKRVTMAGWPSVSEIQLLIDVLLKKKNVGPRTRLRKRRMRVGRR